MRDLGQRRRQSPIVLDFVHHHSWRTASVSCLRQRSGGWKNGKRVSSLGACITREGLTHARYGYMSCGGRCLVMWDRVSIAIGLLSVHDLASNLQTGQSFLPERSSVSSAGITLVLGGTLLEVRHRTVSSQLWPGCRSRSSRWRWQWWQGGSNGFTAAGSAKGKSSVPLVQRCLPLQNRKHGFMSRRCPAKHLTGRPCGQNMEVLKTCR